MWGKWVVKGWILLGNKFVFFVTVVTHIYDTKLLGEFIFKVMFLCLLYPTKDIGGVRVSFDIPFFILNLNFVVVPLHSYAKDPVEQP